MPKRVERPEPDDLPSLMGTAAPKNAERGKGARRLSDLATLRVTSAAVAERCPKEWHTRQLVLSGTGDPGRESMASQLGTWAHEVVESFMRGRWAPGSDRQEQITSALLRRGMAVSEVHHLLDYCASLLPHLPHVVAVEQELWAHVPGVRPKLRGHVDLAVAFSHDHLLIVDHKTNRQPNTLAWWRQQLQPACYAYLARQRWPNWRYVSFRIGYVNLGTTVQWQTDSADDPALERLLASLWHALERAEATGLWPASLNPGCRWCPVQAECSERINGGQRFLASLNLPAPEDDPRGS